MLTVAGICGLPGATAALSNASAHALGGDAGFVERARQMTATNSSPPIRPIDVAGAQWSIAPLWRTGPSTCIAGLVAVTVVDRLEVIEIEGEHADRRLARFVAGHQRGGGGEEAAAVEQRVSGSVSAAAL